LHEVTGRRYFDFRIDRVEIHEWQDLWFSRLDVFYQGDVVDSILFSARTIWVWREIQLE
jgi:hypothetical protein